MAKLIHWLSEGDLTTDGRANEVAHLVASNRELFPDLMAALASAEPAVRGHAAEALEKVGRIHPGWTLDYLPQLRRLSLADPVTMVRWHLAMLLGHLARYEQTQSASCRTLERLLHDPSAAVRKRARRAIEVLTNPRLPLPKGWAKAREL